MSNEPRPAVSFTLLLIRVTKGCLSRLRRERVFSFRLMIGTVYEDTGLACDGPRLHATTSVLALIQFRKFRSFQRQVVHEAFGIEDKSNDGVLDVLGVNSFAGTNINKCN